MINPETMVTMKTKHFLGIVASACLLAACSNQDELLQQDELVAKQCVTVNAYVPDDANSRLAFEDQGVNGLKVSWKESSESFSVMTATMAEPVTFTQTEGSEFAGPNGFTFAEGTDYYAYYPALTQDMLGYDPDTEVPLTTVSATAIPFYFYSQSGQLDENMNLMYAKRSAEGDFQFRHMLAVMKFTLKGFQGELVNDVEISFAHESDLYYTFGTVDVTGENPVFTAEDASYMLIPAENLTADEDGNYTIYAYLPPLAAGTKVSIVAYSENEEDNKYMTWRDEFTVNNEGIKAGYYYTAARKMETSEEENIQLNFTAGNVEELKAWIDALNTYSGVNLTLTADIGLPRDILGYDNDGDGINDSNWPSELWISGTVDGNGYTITNLYMVHGEKAALFGEVQAGGVVKNLHLKNASIGGNKAGGIAVDNYGTISGCSVSGTSSVGVMENGYAGGIVCCNQSDGTVIGCYCSAEVSTAVIGYLGGIVGENAGTVTACYSTSKFIYSISWHCFRGGIACLNGETGTVTTCYWNSASATYGIYFDYTKEYPSDEGATKVDGTTDAWSAAAQAMNEAMPDGFGWQYVENTDNATKEKEPLKLQKVTP